MRETEDRLHTLVDGIPQLVWRAEEEGRWTWSSPQWTEFTGQAETESHGWGWLDPLHPDDREVALEAWRSAAEGGGFEVQYRIRSQATGSYRWFQTRATAVRAADGSIAEWLGTSTDIHVLRELQAGQQLMVAELQHRVRNILTVVRSLFSRTVEAGGTAEDIADHFQGRLDALARTQMIVTRDPGGMTDLENLVRDELLSVGFSDGPRLTISGPDTPLPFRVAESMGLAVHELTTNAVKYGALRIAGATLDIRWNTGLDHDGQRRLDFTWREQGVPAVSVAPAHFGFGRELIEEALPFRLGAKTKLEFRGGGVCCCIALPLSAPDGARQLGT